MIINSKEAESLVYQILSEDSLEAWITCVLSDVLTRRDVDGSPNATNAL